MDRNPRPDETEDQRYDRELLELLNEVRVAMPGVQVLFGFLLAVPFQQRFALTTAFQRDVYAVTLVCSAAATAFLVAPVAYHRLMFRRRDKPLIIEQGNASLLVGLALLATAMTGAVLLVSDVIFHATTMLAIATGTGLLFAGMWFGVGTARRLSGRRSRPEGPGESRSPE
jgi:hypothetical protein